MRYCLLILAIWLGMSAVSAKAAEVVLGVVDSVDRERGIVTLKVIDSSGETDGQPRPESLSVTVNPDRIPECVFQGNTIRIWGEFVGSGLSFRADSIRGGSTNSRNDPTGVRSRLGRGYQSGRGGGRMGGGRSPGR
jgi:hypothetical protein